VQFSDTAQKQGLVQDCEQLVFSNYGDITNYPDRLYDFTARMNRSLDKVASKIMQVDGRWQWDDTNYTDFPIGVTNIVNGQADYTLDVTHLIIEKVTILDSTGNSYIIYPIDIQDPVMAQYLQTPVIPPTGQPTYYDKKGGSIVLFPTPNYDATAGLTVHYKRPASYFTYTDTIKTPGIPSIFHRYVSLDASLDYAVSKRLSVKDDLAVLHKDMEDMIQEHYQKRSKDEPKFIRAINYSSR
jgi:hypothetical protein